MTPEEFMRLQSMPKQPEPVKTEKPKPRKPKPEKYGVPEAIQKAQEMGLVENPRATILIGGEQDLTVDSKLELLAKGMVFSQLLYMLLFTGILVFVGVLYPYPLNTVIIVMAVAMAVISFWNMRKFRR